MAGQHEKVESWMDPNKFMWGPSKSTQMTPQQVQFDDDYKRGGFDEALSGARVTEGVKKDREAEKYARDYKAWQEKAQSLGVGEDQNFWDWLMITLGIK